eukprot:gene6075-149_t
MEYSSSLANVQVSMQRPNYKFFRGSILDATLVDGIFASHPIDTVMHFAALTHVDLSFAEGAAAQFTMVNVLGTQTLLEAAARKWGVKRFLHVSTDEVYGSVAPGAKAAEDSPLRPSNPYSASKAAAEVLVQMYHRAYGLPIIITRGNNAYGPGQFPEKVVPKFILRLLSRRPCCLHGDGGQSRNWLYVVDACRAFDIILHKGLDAEVYNIGSDVDCSVRDLVPLLVKAVAQECARTGDAARTDHLRDTSFIHAEVGQNRVHNDTAYRLDSSKVLDLGWAPSTTLTEGISTTVHWFVNQGDALASRYSVPLEHLLAPHPLSNYGSAACLILQQHNTEIALSMDHGPVSDPQA